MQQEKGPWTEFENSPPMEASRNPNPGPIVIPNQTAQRDREREDEADARDAVRTGIAVQGADIAESSEARAGRKESFDYARDLRREFRASPQAVEFQTVIRQFNHALQTQDNPTGDQALITAYAKMLDPGSVVREQEFNTVAAGDSSLGQAIAKLQKELGVDASGLLRPEVRERVRREMLTLAQSYADAYNQVRRDYRGMAERNNLNADDILGEHYVEPYRERINKFFAPDDGGEGQSGGPEITVTEEESLAYWGEAYFDENGKPIGRNYQGTAYDREGNEVGLVGSVTDDSPPEEPVEQGVIPFLSELVTGDMRSTDEIESLPDIGSFPLGEGITDDILNQLQVSIATMATSPAETAAIIQDQVPGTRVRRDEKGNYILRNPFDGQEYAIKPGFRPSDISRTAGTIAAFTPAGRATTLAGGAAAAAGTQAVIEGTQAASGGSFDTDEIALAGGAGAAGVVLDKGLRTLGGGIQRLRGRGGAAAETGAETATAASASEATEELGGEAAEAIGDLARKAVSRSPGAGRARRQLAEMARVNPEAREAAERIGVDLPVDILSDDVQLKQLTGMARSQVGSEAETAWLKTAGDTVRKMDEAFDAIDASTDLAQVSDDVFAKLNKSMEGARMQAKALRDEVDALIDPRGNVDASALQRTLGDTIEDMGGLERAKELMSAQERRLLNALGEGETAKQPTYAYLSRLRREIGQALERKQGPWADVDEATLRKYYGALAEDRLAHVARVAGDEAADKMRASNSLFEQMYALRDDMTDLFGPDLNRGLAPLLNRAIVQGGKGDAKALNEVLSKIPEELQGPALTSALLAQGQARSARGGFSFANFAKAYRGLREQGPVYARFARAVGPEADAILRDVYAISRRMADADSRILRTGKSNQAILARLTADSLLGTFARGAAGRVMGTAAGGAAGGPVGAGAMAAIGELLERGGKSQVDKLHQVLNSQQFLRLVDDISAGGDTQSAQNALLNSGPFNRFMQAIGVTSADRSAWLKSALTAGAVASDDDPAARPQELPIITPRAQ